MALESSICCVVHINNNKMHVYFEQQHICIHYTVTATCETKRRTARDHKDSKMIVKLITIPKEYHRLCIFKFDKALV